MRQRRRYVLTAGENDPGSKWPKSGRLVPAIPRVLSTCLLDVDLEVIFPVRLDFDFQARGVHVHKSWMNAWWHGSLVWIITVRGCRNDGYELFTSNCTVERLVSTEPKRSIWLDHTTCCQTCFR